MKKKTARKQIGFVSHLSVDDMAECLLGNLTQDELVELIVHLDAQAQDWGVTEKLHKHFAKEMVKLAEEDKKWGESA